MDPFEGLAVVLQLVKIIERESRRDAHINLGKYIIRAILLVFYDYIRMSS